MEASASDGAAALQAQLSDSQAQLSDNQAAVQELQVRTQSLVGLLSAHRSCAALRNWRGAALPFRRLDRSTPSGRFEQDACGSSQAIVGFRLKLMLSRAVALQTVAVIEHNPENCCLPGQGDEAGG